MIVHLDKLHHYPQNFSFDMPAEECCLPADVGVLTSAIHLDARMRRLYDEITVEGRMSAQLEMPCSRCLKLHEECLDETFELTYFPRPVEEDFVDELELDESELTVSYYDGETLDLHEIVREQLFLSLPAKPLCKEDCAGLCPSCGQDFNEGTCDCPKVEGDPRFAVLKQLLTQKTVEK